MRNGRSADGIATVRLGVSILRPGRRILDLWQRDAGKHTDIRLELVSMPDDSEAINDIITPISARTSIWISTAFDTGYWGMTPATPSPSIPSRCAWPCHAITHWRDAHNSH